jgi:hypothetical protein
MGSDRFFGAVTSSIKEKGISMGFKNKIIAVCLFGIVGLGILSVGTCGHNPRFSAFARPAYADSGLKIHR